MSVFRRLVNRLKMKKVHDGKPYSVKELMSMSNDELGRLYRDNGLGQPVGKHKIECMSFIIKCISVAVGFIIALPIPIVLLFVPESMLPPVFTACLVLALMILGSTFMAYPNSISSWYEKMASIRSGSKAFEDVAESGVGLPNLNDTIDYKGNTDGLSSFLHKVDKAIWFGKSHDSESGCPIYDYASDEEFGRMVKIILPVMKLYHDDALNDGSFEILDEKLSLSDRIKEFNKDVLPAMISKMKKDKTDLAEKEISEKTKKQEQLAEKKRKLDKYSIGITESLLDNINKKNEKEVLRKSTEFRKIKDLNNRLNEQKTKLDTSLTSQAQN